MVFYLPSLPNDNVFTRSPSHWEETRQKHNNDEWIATQTNPKMNDEHGLAWVLFPLPS